MRADLRKHCISRSFMPSACRMQVRTGSKRDPLRIRGLGLARGLGRCSTADGVTCWTMACSGVAHPSELRRGQRASRCCWGRRGYVCGVVPHVQHVNASSGSRIYHHQARGRTEKWTTALKGFAHVPESNQKPSAAAAIGGSCSTAQARVDQRKGGTLRRCTQSWARHRIGHSRRTRRWPSASRSRRSGDLIVR